jgi:Undecaprenyl-phosphate glucose phosphotransferase
MFQRRLQFFRSILYLGDLCMVALCWLAAYYVRFFAPVVPVTKGVPDLELYLTLLGLVLVVYGVVLQAIGLYRRPWARLNQLAWPVFQACTLGVTIAIAITWFLKPYEFSRLVFVHFYVFIIVTMLAYRPILRRVWSRFAPGYTSERVLIVGVDDLGRLVAGKIQKQPVLGLNIVGFLTCTPSKVGSEVDGLPILGMYNEIQEVIARHQVHVVVVALPLAAHELIIQVMNDVSEEMVDVQVVPDLFRYISLRGTVEEFDGLPIIGLRSTPLEGWNRVLKRWVDIVGSLVGLVLLGPLMIALAIGVKLSSPGPVFYRQKRMGLDGKLFNMLKFRSMRVDAEEDCGPVWACEDDPRRTRLGAFMRRTSLDELPQFFNALKGDMSLVGPRPERPEFISDFKTKVPRYMLRHKMKAGITGWAQINGWRGNTSLERRIEHDLYYIENWSLVLDFKIMALTVVRGFVNPHAY